MMQVSVNFLFEQVVCPPKHKENKDLWWVLTLFEVQGWNLNLDHETLHDWGSYRIIFALINT